jgi:2-methylcitrate dehydratase PrpD
MSDDGLTQTLAEFTGGTTYDDLPATVVRVAKDLILDSLACAIGAGSLTPALIVTQVFEELHGVEESTVWSSGEKIPCPHAAFVNAYLANLLDFDDTYSGAGHPGATVVPPALAVAEKVGASGEQFLTSVVLGYEASIRIGLAIEPSPDRYVQGWGYGFQTFGTATVACKLLGLDTDSIRRAFGLAGTTAPVPGLILATDEVRRGVFDWSKNYYGWTAMGGVLAAFLAARGFKARNSILDGDDGFWRMAGSDRCNGSLMTSGLGEEFLLVETEHKPYPACRWAHSSIDALDDILVHHRIEPRDVQEVRVRSFRHLVSFLGGSAPKDIVEAQFGLPYLLALRLHGRSLTPALSEEDLTEPEILDTARKVILEHDPEADRAYYGTSTLPRDRPATVAVKTIQGKEFYRTARSGKGAADRKMTEQELLAKYRGLVEPVAGRAFAERMLKSVERLEELPDMRLLAEGFCPRDR